MLYITMSSMIFSFLQSYVGRRGGSKASEETVMRKAFPPAKTTVDGTRDDEGGSSKGT